MLKISLCTVSMNRMAHLMQTLPRNISENLYENLEFVLLDYNSSDKTGEYVLSSMERYIESGRLIYYRTNHPLFFDRSHSRNLVFNLASGDIICNVDADNYTGKDFAQYIHDEFMEDSATFLTTIGMPSLTNADIHGRICLRKADYLKVGGFDERMVHYGFEDHDIVNRLEIAGLKRKFYASNKPFFEVIKHEESERISNEYSSRNLRFLLVNYESPNSTEVIILFNNNNFRQGKLIDNRPFNYQSPSHELKRSPVRYPWGLEDNKWVEGNWYLNGDLLSLRGKTDSCHFNRKGSFFELVGIKKKKFYLIENEDVVNGFLMFYSQSSNKIIMEDNQRNKLAFTNNKPFGQGEVYKNSFQDENCKLIVHGGEIYH